MASRADIDQWIASQGGPNAVKYGYEDIEVDNPAFNNPDHPNYQGRTRTPDKIQTRRETWTNPVTNATYSVVRTPYGNDQFQDVKETPGTKPSTTAKPSNVYIGTNPRTGKPSQVSEYPDGHKEYDDTQVPAAATGEAKPPETKDEGGVRSVWQPNPGGPNAGGKWVPVGSAPETPAERQVREANAPTQTTRTEVVNGQTYTIITIVPKAGQPGEPGQIVLGPDGKVAPGGVPGKGPVDTPTTVKGPDGKTYIRHVVQKPDGSSDVYHTDQQGARATFPDTAPDEPSVPGPDMPTIVLGSSQEALREYKKKLQEGVAAKLWSQKWADARWGEALQQANVAVQEAATSQREAESTRNAAINLATSRATAGQNAITTALDHVNKINGLLPEGSSLGGQTFAALLGIQMLMQARSGLDTVSPNARPAAVPTVTPADMASPQAMAAKRTEVMANPVFQPQPPTNVQPAPAEAPQPVAPAVVAPAPPSAAPAPSAPAPAPAPTVGPSTVPPHTPATDTRLAPQSGQVSPDGIYQRKTPDGSTLIFTPDGRIQRVGADDVPRQVGTWNPADGPPAENPPVQYAPTPSVTPQPTDQPNGFPAGQTVLPQPAEPSPLPPNEVTKAPASDWPVLAQYQPPVAPALSDTAPQQQPAPYPAVLHSEAAAKPPWQFTPTQIQQMLDAGVPESTIFSVPGRGVAA